MSAPKSPPSVDSPPPKPTLLWDGDCGFCGRCARYLESKTGGMIDYAPYQSQRMPYAEIPEEALAYAVHLVEPDGGVYRAGEAVLRAWAAVPGGGWAARLYQAFPPFAWLVELGYWIVARNRGFFSWLTRPR